MTNPHNAAYADHVRADQQRYGFDPEVNGYQPYQDPNKYTRYSGYLGTQAPPEANNLSWLGCGAVAASSLAVCLLVVRALVRRRRR